MKLWIVHDNPVEREHFLAMLKDRFPEISVEGFDRMPAKLHCDALFIAMNLSDGHSGYEIAKSLRKSGARLPIVILTADPGSAGPEMFDAVDGFAYKSAEATFYGSAKAMIQLVQEHAA